ncbi:hypothetical protein V6N13_149557 [Hibiscus sabdariffa]
MDSSPYTNISTTKPVVAESPYMPCFSNPMQQNTVNRNSDNDHVLQVPSNPSIVFPKFPVSSSNPEILYVVSNPEIGKKLFDAPSSSAWRVELDCFWHY